MKVITDVKQLDSILESIRIGGILESELYEMDITAIKEAAWTVNTEK